MKQLDLFTDEVEDEIQAILASRRKHNTSGQKGEDIAQLRAAILARRAK